MFDGAGGSPVYIAFEGKVYDVSESWHWRGGSHWSLHNAGADLTAEIADAPHGREMLERFPVVGLLAPEEI